VVKDNIKHNYGVIILFPKSSDASNIQQFRPICLLRCIYKLITKTLTLKFDPYALKLFNILMMLLLRRKTIMDGVLSLHKLMQHAYIKKQVGVILKTDFEKAYDKCPLGFFARLS
jgi:hypothetical protein